ncbi:TetR/AcrR family transcriptional regulator [Sporolactobacillus pectinivorans]|uniref:TetR/AcrR family transcriptional regulator n=1 Tax=Sporolactobacillus pectinivorans TaxID=1591408 RepID=UPI000C25CE63|nr:TetR/AcrR family transcriptional regulator [Sporolactobacillus pectinivorans]
MNITKQDIIKSATKLFKKQGYLSTSVQDIANDYGIAKGSIYKYFSSKEELFSEVFDRCQNMYFDETEKISSQKGMSLREKFLQQIVFRFQYFAEYKYILVEFTELPIQQDEKFKPLRQKVRARLISWHKECLENLYGDKIKPYLYDLIFIYRAILKEYLFWIIYEDNILSMEKIAEFILTKMDLLVESTVRGQSISIINRSAYVHYINGGNAVSKEQLIAELIDEAEKTIGKLPYGKSYQEKLNELITILKTELEKEKQSEPLLCAILSYLEKEFELKSIIIQLKNLLL